MPAPGMYRARVSSAPRPHSHAWESDAAHRRDSRPFWQNEANVRSTVGPVSGRDDGRRKNSAFPMVVVASRSKRQSASRPFWPNEAKRDGKPNDFNSAHPEWMAR
jgi:hypothetical protein